MKPITRQILYFSFFILLIAGTYSSFTTLLNYIHNLHGQQHSFHAQVFFVINTVSAIIFNFLIPNLNIKNLKKLAYLIPISFMINYLMTYVGFVTQNSTASLIFTGIGSIFAGVGGSVIWIVSGKYINQICSVLEAKQEQGKFYGILGAIMSFSFFIGAILSATVLEHVGKKHDIYLVLACICLFGVVYCKFLISDIQDRKFSLDELAKIEHTDLQSPFPTASVQVAKHFKCDKMCIFNNITVYRRIVSLLPFQLLNGFMVGYILHCAQDLVFAPNEESKESFLTINLVFIGFGGAFGAYIAGYLSDRFSSRRVFYIGVLSCLASLLLGLLSLSLKMENFSLITSVVSGFAMMYTNGMLVIMCSRNYGGDMHTFAANRQGINVSFLIYNIGINAISRQRMQQLMYYQIILFIAIALISLFFVPYIKQNKICNEIYAIRNIKQSLQLRQVQMHIDSSISTHKSDVERKDI